MNKIKKEFKAQMDQNEEITKGKINWNIWIPVVLWIACVVLGILKVVLRIALYETDEVLSIVDILNAFNSNTFSTFISVVVCKLYQYFSTDRKGFKQEEVSGLSMKNIPATFIISGIYAAAAIFDTSISRNVMTYIFFVLSLIYVICFFKVFLTNR